LLAYLHLMGRVNHLDVHFPKHHHQVVDLVRGDDVRGKEVIDLFIGQITLLLSQVY
jgi:hypothetical protein